jgi:ubiquinone/menaquinone biosynthesis C-methylase UbiE
MVHERRFNGDFERLRSPERIENLEIERIVATCQQVFAPKSVLDAGTGTGLFASSFWGHGLKVTGVDSRADMILEAVKQVPEAHFQRAELENLPFADRSFDLAFLGLVLHETDNPVRALQEAGRVASKGIAVLEWPYVEQPHGPPLGIRISSEKMLALSQQAGLHLIRRSRLKELELTLLTGDIPGWENWSEKD